MFRSLLALAAGLAIGTSALAQLVDPDPDWKEVENPELPALRTSGLIPLDIRSGSLRFGVDPASVSVGPDGVVRYVVVASSPTGTVNAMYEGLRCSTGEMKLYARHNPDSGWVRVAEPQWQLAREQRNSRHGLYIARNGACREHAPNGPAQRIVRDLQSPIDLRFTN